MIARNPSKLEVEKAAQVAAKAFTNLSFEHWQESFHGVADAFGEQFIFIVELDGEMVSSMLCCPAPVYICGELVPHASAGAVGTLPEHRCKGCAGEMMAQCVRVLRQEGIRLSSLWPFSYEYYRKFGWEIAAEWRSYSAQAKVFGQLGDACGARGAKADDIDIIRCIYDAYAPTVNCLTDRSEEWFARISKITPNLRLTVDPGPGTVVHETDGQVDSYMAYEIGQAEDGSRIEVKETIFTSQAARRDMLALLATLVEPEEKITFFAPLDDLFLQDIPNPRVIESRIHPAFQLRMIDPEEAMLSLRPPSVIPGTFTLSIDDPVFKHGFEFGLEVGEGAVSRCKPNNARALRMDVQTLARLYSGYLDVFEAWETGKLRAPIEAIEDMAVASTVFPTQTPYRTWLEPG